MIQPTYKWEARHANVFIALIKGFEEKNIKYFILRNYEGLPDINTSKDVDVIIEPGKYKEAAKIAYEAFNVNGIPNYYVVRYERVRCWLGMDLENDFSVHIDLIEGYLNKGFELFEFEELYNQTHIYNGFRVLDDSMDIAMLLLYKTIAAKQLKPAYRKKISDGYAKNKECVDKILSHVMGKSLSSEIIASLDKGRYDEICAKATLISRRTKQIAFYRHPLKTLYNIGCFMMEKLYRIVWCPNKYKKLIAVEAPDGTGKTTFIDFLCVKLAEMFVTDVEKMHIYHFRPNILPNLGAVGEKATAGKVKQDTDFTNPHRNPPANPISSFLRMTYYWFDYIIGGLICIRKDVQFDKFSIFDRYIYDFIVDPYRSRINLPIWLRKTFARCVYRPQIVFVLLCDADIVYKRKQELSIEEIERQMKVFRGLTSMGKNFCVLDASKSPEEICHNAIMRILEQYTLEIK